MDKGSVWGYGRTSDFLMHISRVFLASATFHYVDDFFGLERCVTAGSAFSGFVELNLLIGCTVKKSKEAPPANTQKGFGCLVGCFFRRGRGFTNRASTSEIISSRNEHFVATRFVTHHCWVVCRESNVLRLINYGSCWARCSQAFVCSTAVTYTQLLSRHLWWLLFAHSILLALCAQPRTFPLSTSWRPVPPLVRRRFLPPG